MLRTRWARALLAGAGVAMLALLGAVPATAALSLPGMPAASLDSVQLSGTTVTLKWTDRSTTEDAFVVWRRPSGGSNVLQRSDNHSTSKAGTGQAYTVTDTIPAGTRQCYGIMNYDYAGVLGGNHSNEVCTSALPALSAPAQGVGIITTLDDEVNGGSFKSTTIGADGLGITAHYQTNPQGLRVSHCDDIECTSVTSRAIDGVDARGVVGVTPSIKIGGDGLPLISYRSESVGTVLTQDLKVAHCVDVVCSSATVTTLDAASTVDNNTSLAIGTNGLGVIAYQDSLTFTSNPTKIKIARCQNVACTNAAITLVDTVGHNPSRTPGAPNTVSIAATPTGFMHLAYMDGVNGMKMATIYPDGTTASSYTVDFPLDAKSGNTPSVAIGRDGLPLVSFYRHAGSTSYLVVGHCLNIYCSDLATKVVDNSSTHTGWWSSIAIGADGFGVISYMDRTNLNLVVAHCTNLACSSVSHVTLDEFGDVGSTTSIAIGSDGLPLVSYADSTNQALKVAHCADAACAEPLIAPFLHKK